LDVNLAWGGVVFQPRSQSETADRYLFSIYV
jgi:hypothetical protein